MRTVGPAAGDAHSRLKLADHAQTSVLWVGACDSDVCARVVIAHTKRPRCWSGAVWGSVGNSEFLRSFGVVREL